DPDQKARLRLMLMEETRRLVTVQLRHGILPEQEPQPPPELPEQQKQAAERIANKQVKKLKAKGKKPASEKPKGIKPRRTTAGKRVKRRLKKRRDAQAMRQAMNAQEDDLVSPEAALK